jgi:hypothetical protein
VIETPMIETRAVDAAAEPPPIAVPQNLDLRILSHARWPETADDTLPPIAGFIVSSFNPLVAEVADRCLRRRTGPAPGRAPGNSGADDTAPARTALLLASVGGDRATARAIADTVRTGRRVPPLLFFQSNPNAVLGHIAARHRLTGPVVCISPPRNDAVGIPADAFAEADWLLRDGDADEVLLIAAEQGDGPGEPDRAEAALLDRRT